MNSTSAVTSQPIILGLPPDASFVASREGGANGVPADGGIEGRAVVTLAGHVNLTVPLLPSSDRIAETP